MQVDRQELAAVEFEHAYRYLRDSMIDALLRDPRRVVPAPGFAGTNTAADLIFDSMSGDKGDQILLDMLNIIALASESKEPELRMLANAFICGAAKRHADFHVGDSVEV